MDNLFMFAAQNTVVALVLALFVFGLTRVWRNPPVVHALWLLVLLKLVAPPVMHVDWSALRLPEWTHARGQIIADGSRIEGQNAERQARFVGRPMAGTTASTRSVTEQDFPAAVRQGWMRARPVLFWFWLGGAALCALVAATRIVRFERLLRDTLPASERLQRLAFEIAGKLGVRRVPDVRYVECVDVPLLWCAGRRPTIALPMRLLRQLDDQQAAMILAHELAHLRRRDHWVRAVELIVSAVYWWNPLVWVIRRQMHQAEDLCCDAWVRWAFPDDRRRYAEVVLKTAESLSASQVGARLLPASPFLRSLSLKARIEMILESRFAPSVSTRSRFVIGLLAFLVLPSFVLTTKTEARAGSKDEVPVEGTVAPRLQDLKAKAAVAKAKEDLENASDKLQFTNRLHRKGFVTTSRRDAQALAVERATLDLQVAETAIAVLEDQPMETPAGKPDHSMTSEFPYVVKFEQGATRFENGDNVTIVDVRGTADVFTPGNIYWIKGTYTLTSRDRATLAAFTTAMDAKNGTGPYLKVQTTGVNKGNGTFTLFLPMACRGWPHVSLYPNDVGTERVQASRSPLDPMQLQMDNLWLRVDAARSRAFLNPSMKAYADDLERQLIQATGPRPGASKSGESFGGNYFGTGDSVLKRWWASKETD